MGNAVACPETGCRLATALLQHTQHVADLRSASLNPLVGGGLMQHALIDQAYRLVGESGRQSAHLQRMSPRCTASSDHRPRGADQLVEMIQDGAAFDQRLTVL